MPAGTVLHNRPDTNSIVGADIYPYSIVGAVETPVRQKAPHMPLGTNSVIGVGIHHTR